MIRLSSDKSTMIDDEYFWLPMESCPVNVKVQLLGDGVAIYGVWDGKEDFWKGWAPVPKVK
jgi:hypothetical protein